MGEVLRKALVLCVLACLTGIVPGASAAPQLSQTLSVSVTGAGHVDGPNGIKCPSACSAEFKEKETVTLTAAADAGWTFSGWSGDCSGSTCTLKMDTGHKVGASFKQQPSPPVPPTAPGLKVSTASPNAGDRVTFDATGLGAVDYKWDLNGDGVPERHTLRQPSLTVGYGQPGKYPVTLTATNAAGQVAVYTREIDVGGAAQTACGVYCNVTFPPPEPEPDCLPDLAFGVVVAEGVCLRRRGAQVVTDRPVRVNGVDLFPTNGALIVFDPAAFTIANEGGLVTAQVGETQIYVGPLNWSGLSGERATVVNLDAADLGVSFEDIQVTARLHVDLLSDGSAELGTDMELPDILGDVAAHILLHTNNADGLRLSGLHIHLPTGWLSDKIPIQNLDLDYDEAENSWGGGLTIKLPVLEYDVGGDFGIVRGAFDHAGVSIGSLGVHIADGVYLQGVRANVQATPFGFGGGITLSYGPEVRGVRLIAADGDFHVTFTDPGVLDFTGTLTILSLVQIGDAYTTYSTDGNLHFGGELHRTWAPAVSMRAGVSGWVEGDTAWGMEGHGSLCLGACFGADVVTSNAGLAMCGHLGFASIGFSYGWVSRVVQVLGPACDLGAFRTAAGPRPAYLAMEAARTVTIGAGLPVTAFAVRGRGAPPLVTLTGPGGVRVTTPGSAAGAKTGRTLVFKNTQDDTTYIAVASPRAGTWRIAAQAGSAAIVSVRNAAGLPKASVSARVRGKGRQRVLSYRVKPLAGQRVVFVERGARSARTIGVATRSSGAIRFAPGPGSAGKRRIVAVVTQNGLPRTTLAVAGYSAPAAQKVGRPGKLVLRRTKTALAISWKAAPRAASYRVDVRSSDGRHLQPYLRAATRSYAVPRVDPRDRVTVKVVAVGASGRAGPARSAVSSRRLLELGWPAKGTVTGPFGHDGARPHPGIDIGILRSLRVAAASPGEVIRVGQPKGFEGYGKLVEVRIDPDYVALYAHLAKIRVHRGEWVTRGEPIGVAGCTGWCTGTHLHFELRRKGTPVNPLRLGLG